MYTDKKSVYSKYTGRKNNCQQAETLQCSECPLARHIEGDRYACGAYHNSDQVVRGHWKATNTCHVALAKLQKYSEQQQSTQGTTVQQSETNPSASILGFCEQHNLNLTFERANVSEHYLIYQDSFLGIVGWITQSKWYALSSEGNLVFEHSETLEKALKALLASNQVEYHLNQLCEQENLKIREPEGINVGWHVLKENVHVGMIGQDVKGTYWAVDKAGFSRAETEVSKYLALRRLVGYLHFQEEALTK